MDTREDLLEPVLNEIGPVNADVVAVYRDGEDSWAVQFDGEAIVNLARRANPNRLEMMVLAGIAPKGLRDEVVRSLLMFNFLSSDSGGARMGLGAVDDTVYLIRDLPETDLTAAALYAEMKALATVAGKWREFLLAAADGEALPPLPSEALGAQA
jgi:hypothetical protein